MRTMQMLLRAAFFVSIGVGQRNGPHWPSDTPVDGYLF